MSKINEISVDNIVYEIEDKNAVHTEADPVFSTSPAGGIKSTDIENWNNKSDFSGDYDDLTNKPDLSQFITNTVNNLTNYYLKSETYTQAEVNNLIGTIQQFHYEIVQELPQTGANNILYLVPKSESQTQNVYDEYVYANNTWEKIGDTEIDLSGYVTTTDLSTALANYTTTTDLTTLLAGKQNTIDSTHKLSSDLVDDTNNTNLFVTSSEKTTWSGKQEALVSGTNIKTINSTSILGSGDITTATSQDIQNDKLTGTSAPTTSTVGYVGQQYTDTTNSNQYVCTAINQSLGEYTWVQINGGGSSEPEPYIINISSNTITPNPATITPILLQRIEDYINKNTPLNLFVNSYNPANYYGKYYQGYYVPLIANVGDLSTGSNKTIYLYTSFPSIVIMNEISMLSYIMLYVQNVTISQDSSGYHFSTERTFSIEYTYCVGDIYSGANNTPHIRNYEGSVPFTTARLALTTVNSTAYTPTGDYNPATKKYVDDYLTTITGYDATKTQTLKNINGVLTWQDD